MASRPKLRGLRAVLFALFVLLMALLAGAMVSGPQRAQTGEDPEQAQIWLLYGVIHTDFVLPYDDHARAQFGFADLPDNTEWLIVGWGSAGFYTSTRDYRDLALGTIWTAATGDDSVLRIYPVPVGHGSPALWGAEPVDLSVGQREALVQAMGQTVTGPVLSGVHLRHGDQFFPARGRFSLRRTCNQWVSEMLRAAGVRFGFFTPLTFSVQLSKWRFGL